MTFALASEYHLLSPSQQSQVTHILIDDGDWSPAMILAATTVIPESKDNDERWEDAKPL